ncbi:MAG: ABC transporter substrate-binding protein, partial [Candidatus Staskawiczbacteria bacterium]|nr:ABC transporter substrate-binding protein [Candidatus Staskawiczbacteria bacterium]
SLSLKANNKYYGKTPYISNITFEFFGNKDDLVKAANQKTIDGFSITALDDNQALAEKEIQQGWTVNEKFNIYSFSMPRYFAVFFNPKDTNPLSDANITQALNYSVNKQELAQKINEAFKEKTSVVNSPILPDYYGFSQPTKNYDFNIDTANKLLDKSGYKDNGSGQRAKANSKTPAFQFKSYLSGTSGAKTEITELQGCLARLDSSFKALLENETNGKYGKGTEDAVTAFQKKYLPDMPSTGEVGAGTRKKLNELCLTPQNNSIPLKFTLTTVNQPQMVETANLLKDYWQKVGVSVDIKTVELSELKDIIKTRSYDALIYGEALGSLPDLYPFWHSTQVNDPGLNLAGYKNKKADQLLKDAREAADEQTKISKYEALQDVILADTPAIFLYNPDYIYWISGKVKGIDTNKIIDPAKRFENISNWFINTKRVWK